MDQGLYYERYNKQKHKKKGKNYTGILVVAEKQA